MPRPQWNQDVNMQTHGETMKDLVTCYVMHHSYRDIFVFVTNRDRS